LNGDVAAVAAALSQVCFPVVTDCPLLLLLQTLCSQTVELVFTAHPTQAFRQSLLKKYARVSRSWQG
jgi:hypothetical protein